MKLAMSRLSMVVLLGLAKWLHAAETAPARLVEDGGFVDLDIPIERVIEDHDLVRIIARGHVDIGDVGLEVDFPLARKAAKSGDLPVSFGTARIRSLGVDSDRFVSFLGKKYRISPPKNAMLQTVDAATAGLGDDGAGALRGKRDMKFFFYADGPEDRYAELYINVDFDSRILEIHEKDPDYRRGVILALTQASNNTLDRTMKNPNHGGAQLNH